MGKQEVKMAEVITKCPLCGGDLRRNRYMKDGVEKESIGCSNWKEKECKFFMFPSYFGTKLSDETIKELIEDGQAKKPVSIKVYLKMVDNKIKMDFSK